MDWTELWHKHVLHNAHMGKNVDLSSVFDPCVSYAHAILFSGCAEKSYFPKIYKLQKKINKNTNFPRKIEKRRKKKVQFGAGILARVDRRMRVL